MIKIGNAQRMSDGRWVIFGIIVEDKQSIRSLNRQYFNTLDLQHMSIRELYDEGDLLKDHESPDLAKLIYDEVQKRNEPGIMYSLAPKLTSCYRLWKKPEIAIHLYNAWKTQYGNRRFEKEILSHALLTSVAMAYCDLADYEARDIAKQNYINSKQFCDYVCKMLAKNNSPMTYELNSAYARLRSRASWLFE